LYPGIKCFQNTVKCFQILPSVLLLLPPPPPPPPHRRGFGENSGIASGTGVLN
jgi:hypothetical protein